MEPISDNNAKFDIDQFVSKQLRMIELEEEEEVKEKELNYGVYSFNEMEKGHNSITLFVDKEERSLYGRWHLTLAKPNCKPDKFKEYWKFGDLVFIGQLKGGTKFLTRVSGVLSDVKANSIVVILKDASGLSKEEQCYVYKVGNVSTYRRLKKAMRNLKKRGIENDLIGVLFGEKSPSSFDSSATIKELDFINKKLNDDQQEAVKFCLRQKEIAVIHGPPGTGKTTTVVEVILQLIKQGQKVLVCAPSNVAADNLVEGLEQYTKKIVRLGHPGRVLPNSYQYSIDYKLSNHENSEIIKDVGKEIDTLRSTMKNSIPAKSATFQIHGLKKEITQRRKDMLKSILQSCEVVVSTLVTASSEGPLGCLPDNYFDVLVIDECSQALECACWIPLFYVKRCIMSGDHLQLPPVVLSPEAENLGLSETLMERLLKLHGDGIKNTLTLQYRMNESIMKWPSMLLYENQLKAHESVASRLLCDLPNIEENRSTSIPLLMIDTAGTHMYDHMLATEDSKGNHGEAQLVSVHVEELIKSGLDPADIAVITPYNLQVDLVKDLLLEKYPTLEIRSVDGFQGREKEAVVLSLVRSNEKGLLGFVQEHRRLNVAITRAKRHLAVICDTTTVSKSEFLAAFVEYMQEFGEVRSAYQYLPEMDPLPVHIEVNGSKSPSMTPKKNARKAVSKAAKEKANPRCTLEENNDMNSTCSERLDRTTKYKEMIKAFLEGPDSTLRFPPDLTSYERMVVHTVAESFEVIHKSVGEGKDRHLILQKPNHEVSKQQNIFELLSDAVTESQTCPDPTTVAPLASDIERPSTNVVTKSTNKNKGSSVKPATSVKKSADSSKSLKNHKFSRPLSQLNNVSMFDELISEVHKLDNSCCFPQCKNHISYLLQKCPFCAERFCLSHHMPEVHGCGAAAKAHARSQIRKEGKLYPGSGVPQSRKNPAMKHALDQKLKKKLSELSNKRKHK